MNICAACGKPMNCGVSLCGTLICRDCEPVVNAEIKRLFSQNQQVNTLQIAKRIFRETNGTTGVLQIRDVPVDLRKRMDQATFDQKISLRELVLKSLYKYLD